MYLEFMNWVTKSSYCRVARLRFKRRATAVLKSNLIRWIYSGTAVARRSGRLKRALLHHLWLLRGERLEILS